MKFPISIEFLLGMKFNNEINEIYLLMKFLLGQEIISCHFMSQIFFTYGLVTKEVTCTLS